MRLVELTPIIYTAQIKETIQFYTEILGFTCHEYRAEWGWAALGKDEVGIMLAKPNEHVPFDKPVFTGSFYLKTDDVDSLWSNLKDKVRICYPIDNFDHGMREFAIYDNNGYMLQFGKEINS